MIYSIELQEKINREDLEYLLIKSASEVKLRINNYVRSSYNGVIKTIMILNRFYILNIAKIEIVGDEKINSFLVKSYFSKNKAKKYLDTIDEKLGFKAPIKEKKGYVLTTEQ